MDLFHVSWVTSESEDESTMIVHCGISKVFPIRPKYKLTYFNAKGTAEISRMILAHAQIPFIDCRISVSEWQKNRNDSNFGILPVLEFDGRVLCHGAAIVRFLGQKYKLAGKDSIEQAQCDAILNLLKECGACLKNYIEILLKFYVEFSTLPEKQIKDSIVKFAVPVIEKFLPILEFQAANNHLHGFLLPSGLSYADFAVASFFETLSLILPSSLLNYGNVQVIKERIFSLSTLQSYLKNRPKTVL